jgi:Lamin Tail Domain
MNRVKIDGPRAPTDRDVSIKFGPAFSAAIAAATVVAGFAVAPDAIAASSSGARITAIYFDSPGSDTGSSTSLNAEWVRIKNYTSTRKTLTGWTLRDKQNHVYKFPTFSLAAGAPVRIHTGSGTNTVSNLYWRQRWYIWNNAGNTAYLRNAAGTLRDTCSYTSAKDPEVFC